MNCLHTPFQEYTFYTHKNVRERNYIFNRRNFAKVSREEHSTSYIFHRRKIGGDHDVLNRPNTSFLTQEETSGCWVFQYFLTLISCNSWKEMKNSKITEQRDNWARDRAMKMLNLGWLVQFLWIPTIEWK